MKKFIKYFLIVITAATAFIILLNKLTQFFAKVNENLPFKGGQHYHWRHGDIFYIKKGHGTPLLLIHDLNPISSSIEWHRVINKFAQNYTVYAIDLLGCGRSDKPKLTYTNYMYVQLMNDFIREIIKEKTDIISTGASFSFSVMACQMEAKNYRHLIAISPTDLHSLAKTPDSNKNHLKFMLELPIMGTFLYNLSVSKKNIREKISNQYFFQGEKVPDQLIQAYYKSAHRDNGYGKFLWASMHSSYTNINIVPALKKMNHPISLIGGSEKPYSDDIIDEYQSFNPSIEKAIIKGTRHLPQIEKPTAFVETINIFLS